MSILDAPDPLTGLETRTAYDKWLTNVRPDESPAVLMIVDVDHFKRINDTAGHAAGDVALRQVGTTLRRLVERYVNAHAFRYGGDEFVVVMSGYSSDEGVALARNLASSVAALDTPHVPKQLTLSIGLASFDSAPHRDLLKSADAALMVAKQNGRNRLEVFGEQSTRASEVQSIVLNDDLSGNRAHIENVISRPPSALDVPPEPTSTARTRPRDTGSLPAKVRRIYQETLAATSSELDVLAAIGVRALIESVCSDCSALGHNLQQKIDDRVAKGLLAPNGALILHQMRFLGNRAAHEVEAPTTDELAAALEVAEYLLNTVYILPKLAARLPTK